MESSSGIGVDFVARPQPERVSGEGKRVMVAVEAVTMLPEQFAKQVQEDMARRRSGKQSHPDNGKVDARSLKATKPLYVNESQSSAAAPSVHNEAPTPQSQTEKNTLANEPNPQLFTWMDDKEKALGLMPDQQTGIHESRQAMVKTLKEQWMKVKKNAPRLVAIGGVALTMQQSGRPQEAQIPDSHVIKQSEVHVVPQPEVVRAVPPNAEVKPPTTATATAPESKEKPFVVKKAEEETPLFEKYKLKSGEFPWTVIDRLVQEKYNDGKMDPATFDSLTNALVSLQMGADGMMPGKAYNLQVGHEISVPTPELIQHVLDNLNNPKESGDPLLGGMADRLARPDLSPTGPGKVKDEAQTWTDKKFTKEEIARAKLLAKLNQ